MTVSKTFGQRRPPESHVNNYPSTPIQRKAFEVANAMRSGEKFILRDGSANELNNDREKFQVANGDMVNIVTADLLIEIAMRPEWQEVKSPEEKELNFSMLQVFKGYFSNSTNEIIHSAHQQISDAMNQQRNRQKCTQTQTFGRKP